MNDLQQEPWLGTEVRCYPNRVRTIIEALDVAAAGFADRPAVETPDRTVTYRELAELVEAAADRLTALGLRRGDRLAVAAPNGLDMIVAIWACARIGLLFTGLSTRLRATQWAYMLGHCKPALAIASSEYLDQLRQAVADSTTPARPIGDTLTGRRTPWRGNYPDRPFPDQDDVYGIIYTSGTTGHPKASQLVHRATMHSAIAYIRTLGLTGEDRTPLVFPLYYITAHVAQVTPMMLVGGTSITVAHYDTAGLVTLMSERHATYLMVVPNIWQLLLRDPRFGWPDLAHVRIGAFGGSPVPISTITALRNRMPQLRLFDAYGLTETHSPATILTDAEFWRKPGSVGRALPCADLRIVDDEGVEQPAGQPGELLIRGPMITPGYYNDPAATAAAITNGWLHTGDYARIDDEGYVYLLDRKKDVINRGGNKIYSVELEYLLVSHPAIAQAAAIGIPNALAGEDVAVFIVPAVDTPIDATTIRKWIKQHLADYAVPRHVQIVDQLPRNRTGKIEKNALRQQLLNSSPHAG